MEHSLQDTQTLNALTKVLAEARQQGLKAAFKTAANSCGRFGAFLVNEGLAVLEANSQTLVSADLPSFPQDLAWAEIPESALLAGLSRVRFSGVCCGGPGASASPEGSQVGARLLVSFSLG